MFALEFVAVNLLVDVLYTRIDPRIRYQSWDAQPFAVCCGERRQELSGS